MGVFKTNDMIEKSIKNNYIKACNDIVFKKLINSLKVQESELVQNTSKLQDCVEELNNCKGCKGLVNCKNSQTGYVFYPYVYNNSLEFTYKPCKYKKMFEKQKEEVKTAETELLLAGMEDVDYKDKSRIKLLKWIDNFIEEYDPLKKHKGLYLHGNFGSGKTFIVSAMFNELKKKGIVSEIVYFPTLLRDLKSNFDELETTLAYLENVDLLLIDDIGAEKVSEWARDEILGTILQSRMNNRKTTFFTSNFTIEELDNHLSNNGTEVVRSGRIIERIKVLTEDMVLLGENRRK